MIGILISFVIGIFVGMVIMAVVTVAESDEAVMLRNAYERGFQEGVNSIKAGADIESERLPETNKKTGFDDCE